MKIYSDYKVIGIYPGRFQLPHKGHKNTFRELKKKCDNAYIQCTETYGGERYPFTFDERKELLNKLLDIPYSVIFSTKSPYTADKVLNEVYCRPEDTVVIFACGKKDWKRFKGRNDSLVDISIAEYPLEPYSKKAYVMCFENEVNDNNEIISATDLRDTYKQNPNIDTICKLYDKSYDYIKSNNIDNIFSKLI